MVAGVFAGTALSASAEGKITYWSMWESTEPQGQAIQEAVDAYSAETGVEVDLQFKGRTGIREGLQAALDAGTEIDLFDEDIDRVNKTWGDYLLDLEEMAAAADYESTAISGLISACREVGGGTLKSIPYQPNVFAFFYNKAIFEEAGVEAVPTTWDEFLDTCQKIQDAGYTPITCDDAYITCMFGYHLGRLIGEEGVTRVVENGEWAEEPAVLQMAQAYEELATKGYFSEMIEGNVWPAGQNTELALGTAAMYLNGSWLPNEVKEMAGDDFQWGCFNYPAVEGGVTGTEAANYGAQVYAINKDSKNPQAAFDLICYITKGEYDQKLSEMSIGIPADTTNGEWPALLADVKPVMDSLSTRFSWAVNCEANANITPVLKENMLKLCGGSITAQEFVDNMEAAS
ncbi:MAG: ABC transporter substrate-binding protein [Eubacteriales bacterium]|nr:ABC transporter substrate-binding protein [Eubacteriales bacterium]